jgi:hypothetical protein
MLLNSLTYALIGADSLTSYKDWIYGKEARNGLSLHVSAFQDWTVAIAYSQRS